MKVRDFQSEDYEIVSQWWGQWGWPAIPLEFLPPNGLVIDGVCAVWVYLTDTPIAWIEHYISDKAASKADRDEGLNLLIDAATERAKEKGALVAMSSVRHNGLSKRLSDKGFVKSDENMTTYIRGL